MKWVLWIFQVESMNYCYDQKLCLEYLSLVLIFSSAFPFSKKKTWEIDEI